MGIRLSTKKLIYSGLAGATGMIVICGVGGYFGYNHMQEKEIRLINQYEEELSVLEKTAAQSEIAYALKTDIEKGTVITEDMLNRVYVPTYAISEDVVEPPDLTLKGDGTLFAKTDLKANTVLVESMFYSNENISNDAREAEYSFIELPSNVAAEKYVDIRIQFPTGDEYVVLSKKRVNNIAGMTVWMNVEESEILTISSAIVDAYVQGAKIYAMPYVDSQMQKASTVTYPVKDNVKELITDSPNVVNFAALRLEERNRLRLENNLNALDEDAKAKVENGDSQTNLKAEESKSTAEDRMNELNSQAVQQQQDLIGGGEE